MTGHALFMGQIRERSIVDKCINSYKLKCYISAEEMDFVLICILSLYIVLHLAVDLADHIILQALQ